MNINIIFGENLIYTLTMPKKSNSSDQEEAVKMCFTIRNTLTLAQDHIDKLKQNVPDLVNYENPLDITIFYQQEMAQGIHEFMRSKEYEIKLYLCGKTKYKK